MLIGLHDAEKEHLKNKTFPNYALMKIAAWHKMQGDQVSWWLPLYNYDKVYSSKVFDFTPENPYLPETTERGGTGYDMKKQLLPAIEDMYPDYSIYPNLQLEFAQRYVYGRLYRHENWNQYCKRKGFK